MSNKCIEKCDIFARVTGYIRPIRTWNKGKVAEFRERKTYKVSDLEK